MKTISVQSEISADGTLRLVLPTGLAPGPTDVVVVVQPTSSPSASHSSLSGKYAGRLPMEMDIMAESRNIRVQTTDAATAPPVSKECVIRVVPQS